MLAAIECGDVGPGDGSTRQPSQQPGNYSCSQFSCQQLLAFSSQPAAAAAGPGQTPARPSPPRPAALTNAKNSWAGLAASARAAAAAAAPAGIPVEFKILPWSGVTHDIGQATIHCHGGLEQHGGKGPLLVWWKVDPTLNMTTNWM